MKKNIFTRGVLIRLIILIVLLVLVYFFISKGRQGSTFDGGDFTISSDTEKEEYLQKDILERDQLTEAEVEEMNDSESVSINMENEEAEEVDPKIIEKAKGINSFQECKDAGFEVTADVPAECWAGEKGFYEIKK